MEVKEPNLENLISKSESKEFILPNFQRDYVWAIDKQKTLISTFLVNLPSGNFLTLEGESGDFAAREVCNRNSITPKSNCVYLLDGQQRFSTLKNALCNMYDSDPAKWRETWDNLFNNLKYRFYLSVHNSDNHDYFGLNKLAFNEDVFNRLEPSMLFDNIKEKRILVKDTQKYFHPGYQPQDKDGKPLSRAKRIYKVGKELADEGLIPLYDLFQSDKHALHRAVLRELAHNRVEELKLEVDKKKDIVTLLENTDPNIDEYLDEADEGKIESTWNNLASQWSSNVSNYLEGKLKTKMVELQLERDEVDRAFAIFEVINQPGTPLDEYDLIVARAARNVSLDQLSTRIIAELSKDVKIPNSLTNKVNGTKPKKITPTDLGTISDNSPADDLKTRFLQMLSIISYSERKPNPEEITVDHLKRGKILKLQEQEINENYERALRSVIRAYAFLHIRCGVVSITEIPYKLMLIPIACQFLKDSNWTNKNVHNKIEHWYWVSLFGGAYKSDQYQQAKEDIDHLGDFISPKGSDVIDRRYDKVFNVEEYCNKEILLCQDPDNSINPNLHKGVLQYILSNQPYDFLKKGSNIRLTSWSVAAKIKFKYKDKEELMVLEDHHICPLYEKKLISQTTTAEIRKDKKEILNSPINRTLITKISNREIGSMSPKDYFKFISDSSKFNHCIPSPIESVYEKGNSETVDDYYYRVCERRFEELSSKLKQEVLDLVDK